MLRGCSALSTLRGCAARACPLARPSVRGFSAANDEDDVRSWVLVERDSDGFATLTLNRPAVHNAFSDVMIGRLHEAVTELEADAGLWRRLESTFSSTAARSAAADGLRRAERRREASTRALRAARRAQLLEGVM